MKINYIRKNIRNFRLCSNDKIFITLKNEIIINDELIYHSENDLQEIYTNDTIAYTNTINGNGIKINLINKNIDKIENLFIKYIDSSFEILIENKKSIIKDIKTKSSIIKPYRLMRYLIDKKFLKILLYEGNNLTNTNLNIKVTSLIQDTDYLTFPLSTLGTWLDGTLEKPYQVAEFSGIYENTLVCTMNNGGVLLLDIEKGEVKSFFKDAKVKGGIYQKEEKSPIFIGLKHYSFIELNSEIGEIIRQVDIQNELKRMGSIPDESPCWLSVGTSIYQDGLFYFYGDTNIIGIFDPNTEKIIDYHEFEFDKKQYQQLKGGVENLQVKDGKIYCLDSLGNLYELER